MTTTTYASTREASARKMPWNVMGKALDVDATSVTDALAKTGMDYTVRLIDVQGIETVKGGANDGLTVTHDAPMFRAVVRPLPDGSDKLLGITGTRFRPIQNVEAFAPADYLVSEFGAKIVGAADYRNGSASLLVVDLAEPVILDRPDGGTDRIDLDLLIKNTHDGSGALTLALTGIRLACTNAVQAAVRDAERVWKISHTPNAKARLDVAAEAIKKATSYRQEFTIAAQAMMDAPMIDAEFAKIVSGIWKADAADDTKAAERRREVQAEVLGIYRSSSTLEGVRGTRWAGYSAVTEWLDWARPVKGDSDQAKAQSRAEGALDGPYVRAKARAWSTFAAV